MCMDGQTDGGWTDGWMKRGTVKSSECKRTGGHSQPRVNESTQRWEPWGSNRGTCGLTQALSADS